MVIELVVVMVEQLVVEKADLKAVMLADAKAEKWVALKE